MAGISGWIVYRVRGVLAPLAAGLLLAYILNPIVNALERRGIGRVAGTAVLFVGVALMMGALAAWVIPPSVRSSIQFVKDTIPKVKQKLPELHEKLEIVLGKDRTDALIKEAEDKLKEHGGDLLGAGRVAAGAIAAKIGAGVDGLLTVVSWLVLVPIYCAFSLVGMDPLWKKAQAAIPEPLRPRALATLAKIHRANSAFFRGQTTICLIKAVLGTLLYWAVGLPFWPLVGLIHGLLSFFPFVGVSTTFVLVAVLGYVDAGWTLGLVWPILALMLLEGIEGFLLQPTILGKETGLHPVMVILAFLIVGELFGIFGLLMAVPLFTAGLILFKDYVVPLYMEVGGHIGAELSP